MFGLIQLLITILIGVLIVVIFNRQKKERILIIGLVICLIFATLVSNIILTLIPLPTERISLLATGEKNEQALSNEVALSGVLVDGKIYELNNAVEGKWFWQGNLYMWRDENSLHQPEGTTRNITLNIPVGRERGLIFNNNEWRGIVEIIYNDIVEQYDLYSASPENLNVDIAPTDNVKLFFIKIFRLFIFICTSALLMLYPIRLVIKLPYNTIKSFCEKNWDKLIYILISLCCFIVMFIRNKAGSLWADELYNLGWYYTEIPDNSLVIFHALYRLWFKIVPYGHEYLLMISEFFVVLAVYFMGISGNLFAGKRFGIIAASLLASSTTALFQCGAEFRPYAIWLFSVTAILYFFIKKQKGLHRPKTSTLLLYGAALVLCMDSHPMGLIMAGFMIIFDFMVIVWGKLQNKLKLCTEFILPALYGFYYILFQFMQDVLIAQNYSWPPAPSLKESINFVIWLNSNNISYFLLILGLSVIITNILWAIFRQKFDWQNDYILLVNLSIPILLFAFIIIYSSVLNPTNSIFVARYLVPCIVFFVFIIAMGLEWFLSIFIKQTKNEICKLQSLVCTLFIVMSLCAWNWYVLPADTRQDYKGSADYLMSQIDIYDPTTICMVTSVSYVDSGFEYYLTHKGKRDTINHCSLDYSSFVEYDTVYVVYHHQGFDTNVFLQNGYIEENSNDSLAIKRYVRIN